MITDVRAQGIRAAGFPVGCAFPGARGQVTPAPAPATSNHDRQAETASAFVLLADEQGEPIDRILLDLAEAEDQPPRSLLDTQEKH
ncbi:hypothetical protein [Saccharopolyspora spinosa]|uniref:hypothetical protein n=1 Tax=Saccharopolyspora spinosa TaxID=60894 RepID=UPI00030492B6|nr:hypothetical protein [Saccharopolyspora spinosa]